MDRHNNEIGFEIGRNAKNLQEVIEEARKAISNGYVKCDEPGKAHWLDKNKWRKNPLNEDTEEDTEDRLDTEDTNWPPQWLPHGILSPENRNWWRLINGDGDGDTGDPSGGAGGDAREPSGAGGLGSSNFTPRDPLVLDLDADGIELTSLAGSNADGQINSDDAIFGDLRIWQDSDSDGIADEGELHTLNALEIVSIDVAYESGQFTTDSHNVEHRERSLFTYDNGTTGLTNTLWFDSDRGNTVPVEVQNGDGIVIPDDVALLPDVKGFGNAYTLHQAMALDDSGKLKALVQAFVAESDITLRKALVGDILALWTGQQDTDPASRGNDIDGQHLGILETFWGQAAFQENPDGQYAQILKGVYE